MPSTGINRRCLFALGLAAPLALRFGVARAAESPAQNIFVSARGDADGGFHVTAFDGQGRLHFDLPLPGRGHAAVQRPGRTEAVVFARRPGRFAVALDVRAGEILHRLDSVAGRHFYGHGVFSKDGRTLFTTENAYDQGSGVIGIWDAADGYRRIGEYPAYEIGPHDIGLLSDGKTLVVANGGILTDPETGRTKLNRAEMTPSLAYVDVADGALRGDYRLAEELHQVSIRHLDIGPDDRVAVACQYEGPRGDQVPLVGLHNGEESVALLTAPPDVQRRMRNYCGSACIDDSGAVLAVSCPRGNLVTFWDLSARRYLSSVALVDGCGIARGTGPGRFLLTGGRGDVLLADALQARARPLNGPLDRPVPWDNHALSVTAR